MSMYRCCRNIEHGAHIIQPRVNVLFLLLLLLEFLLPNGKILISNKPISAGPTKIENHHSPPRTGHSSHMYAYTCPYTYANPPRKKAKLSTLSEHMLRKLVRPQKNEHCFAWLVHLISRSQLGLFALLGKSKSGQTPYVIVFARTIEAIKAVKVVSFPIE